MVQLQLEPLSRSEPTPTRGAIAQEGFQIGEAASVNDFVVFETETEDIPFIIGQPGNEKSRRTSNWLQSSN